MQMQTDGGNAQRREAAGVPSVHRAVAMLSALAHAPQPLTLTELARSLGLPKSSTHGLCQTLAAHGYVRRAEGGFSVGPAVMPLAHAFVRTTSIPNEFSRLWNDLTDRPRETVVLSMLAGHEVLYVAARNGNRPLGLSFSEGMQLPAHLAASGKAVLAWRDERDLDALFRHRPLTRMTHAGPADLDALMVELREVRERGYAVDDEGVREGVVSFAAPVFDTSGAAVAGIGVCVHKTHDLDAQRAHARRVVDLAQQLTRRLGGVFPSTSTTA